MLARLFSEVLKNGFRGIININCHQKGFTLKSGAFNNIFALNKIKNDAIRKNDSIPHFSILDALNKFGIHEQHVAYKFEMNKIPIVTILILELCRKIFCPTN